MRKLIYTIFLLATITSCKKEDNEPTPNDPGNSTPVSMKLESITMAGFDQTDSNGDYWDTSTNPPDIFVNVFKSGALVYTSEIQASADHNAIYMLNTPSSGTLPVTYSSSEPLKIEVRDNDSATASEIMGQIDIVDALNFFDNGDGAAGFTDVAISTSNGHVNLRLSGTFQY
jgi:hypothetical protein